jgi:uncharacterized membrane protein
MEAENNPPPPESESTLDLKPGTASLLCYMGGWITGIIFLILEQKNRLVRFHAAQSIIVFGFLQVAGLLLKQAPIVGNFLGGAVGILAFILWIILMVKASQGYFNLPPAGDLAEKILGSASGPTPGTPSGTPQSGSQGTAMAPPPPPPPPPPQAAAVQAPPARAPHRFDAGRAGRITASAFAIAFSIAMLIFLNFFHEYIAYYHQETAGGVSTWLREPLLTADFSAWLPIVNTALICGIAGHALCLAIDKYIMREGTMVILDIFSAVSITALLVIFPFDFSPFGHIWSTPLDLSVRITMAIIIFGICVGVLVRLIKILVNGVRGTATY